MEYEPKVSVIVPIYNVEDYISESVVSLMKQSYSNFEVIMINDGSTDSSLNIVKKLIKNDDRFILRSTVNMGQSHARNIGLKMARGEFIAFLDPDDTYENDFLKRGIEEFDDKTDIVSYMYPNKNLLNVNGSVSKDKFISLMFLGKIGTVVWNKIFRKSRLKNVFFPDGEVHEEVFFFLKLMPNLRKCKIINDSLYNYRVQRKGNTNSTFNVDRLYVVHHQIDFINWLSSMQYSEAYSAVTINLLIFLRNYINVAKQWLNDSNSYESYKEAKLKFNYVFDKYVNFGVFNRHKKTFFRMLFFKCKLIVKEI